MLNINGVRCISSKGLIYRRGEVVNEETCSKTQKPLRMGVYLTVASLSLTSRLSVSDIFLKKYFHPPVT